MKAAQKWQDWEVFAPAAKAVLEEYYFTLHRCPTIKELATGGHRWIANAAIVFHGGYVATLKRLKFPYQRVKRTRRQRANWAVFSRQARAVLDQMVAKLGRLPKQKELKAAGYHWLVTAAYYHHDGLVNVYDRLGYDTTGIQRPWKWKEFAPIAKRIIEAERLRLGRTPYWHEMLAKRSLRWILYPCQEKFGGYRAVLRRLGIPPTEDNNSQRGTGLADWSVFEAAVRPIIDAFVAANGRVPYVPEMKSLGQGRYVSAAGNHHGGYIKALQRMGYPLNALQQRPKHHGWRSVEKQRAALREHFPEHWRLGIMPSSTAIARSLGGLHGYIAREKRTWGEVARSFGLIEARPGLRILHYTRSVIEALDFYETHRRWPKGSEASATLRRLRWSHHMTWGEFFHRTDLTKQAMNILVERWHAHAEWCRHHKPEARLKRIRIMNRLVIVRNGSSAPSRPS